jgi:hypothetical protein
MTTPYQKAKGKNIKINSGSLLSLYGLYHAAFSPGLLPFHLAFYFDQNPDFNPMQCCPTFAFYLLPLSFCLIPSAL